jgi:thiamine-monophosphate kinase
MNVSDLAAKGVQPKAALVSLGLPSNFKEEDIKLIGLGLNAGAREYGAYVIGGDTNEAKDLVIDCLLFGLIDKGKLIGRSGAKPSDILAVTGPFGKTAAGLKAIVENLKAPEEIKGKLLEAVYMPKAKLREGLTLADANLASASIDSSDGLAWSLHEISRMSGVGFIVDNLPIAPEALKFVELNELDPFELAFYGGEEYELVVTIRPEKWGQAVEKIKSIGGQLIKIGVATEKRELVLKTREEVRKIEPRGWQHFIRF